MAEVRGGRDLLGWGKGQHEGAAVLLQQEPELPALLILRLAHPRVLPDIPNAVLCSPPCPLVPLFRPSRNTPERGRWRPVLCWGRLPLVAAQWEAGQQWQ